MNRHDLLYSVYSGGLPPHMQQQPIRQPEPVQEVASTKDWAAHFQAIQEETDRSIERYNAEYEHKEAVKQHNEAVTNLFFDAIGLAIALKLTKI